MNPLPWLLSLFLPACGAEGAQGFAVPTWMDMAAIVRPATPNTVLAGPAGFKPEVDMVIVPFSVSPGKLYDAIQAVAAAQPWTYPAARFDDVRQMHYVARSALMNYPDLITVDVAGPKGGPKGGPTTLVIYSRSVYGRKDFGVNRARIETWLAALPAQLEK